MNDLTSRLKNPATRREAFEELVRSQSQNVYRNVRRLVLDHEDANDVVQNVFLKAWLSLDSFRGDAQLSTWLYRIAINESLTFLSKKKKEQSLSLDDTDVALTLKSDSYFDGSEAQALLQAAIATLPDKQRVVFNLKYFEEMKYEEMSEVLDTSVGALKASYHFAVQKIEAWMKQHE
ncbi:MAG: sigma-70 family RNA polymerase sigma factor [Alloprevotella sp.]|nr:sigma-70 family RNA polymerase sigma factor [Alloprevotella sp.]